LSGRGVGAEAKLAYDNREEYYGSDESDAPRQVSSRRTRIRLQLALWFVAHEGSLT